VSAERQEFSRQSKRQCGAVPSGFKDEAACTLDAGHNSPHEALDGTLKWEPLYAGDLRRRVEDLENGVREALDLLRTPASEWARDERDTLKWLEGLVA